MLFWVYEDKNFKANKDMKISFTWIKNCIKYKLTSQDMRSNIWKVTAYGDFSGSSYSLKFSDISQIGPFSYCYPFRAWERLTFFRNIVNNPKMMKSQTEYWLNHIVFFLGYFILFYISILHLRIADFLKIQFSQDPLRWSYSSIIFMRDWDE